MNFILTRLWRYLNIYFLKPFDAVNDTLTSYLVFKKHKLEKDYLELGSGDGMYSFIMSGGKFPLNFDRYIDVSLKKKDIFDTHKKEIKVYKNKNLIRPYLSIDAKKNHVKKIKEIGFSKYSQASKLENIKIKNKNKFSLIFFYTAHGLNDFKKSIKQAKKLLKKNGKILILVFDDFVKKNFVCYKMSKKNFFPAFFRKIDNGRFKEIGNYSKTTENWMNFFEKNGLKVNKISSGLSGTAWKVYDVQTRPILFFLIRFFNTFPSFLRVLLKLIWMIFFYPVLILFFLFYSNIYFSNNKNCYHVFELRKR